MKDKEKNESFFNDEIEYEDNQFKLEEGEEGLDDITFGSDFVEGEYWQPPDQETVSLFLDDEKKVDFDEKSQSDELLDGETFNDQDLEDFMQKKEDEGGDTFFPFKTPNLKDIQEESRNVKESKKFEREDEDDLFDGEMHYVEKSMGNLSMEKKEENKSFFDEQMNDEDIWSNENSWGGKKQWNKNTPNKNEGIINQEPHPQDQNSPSGQIRGISVNQLEESIFQSTTTDDNDLPPGLTKKNTIQPNLPNPNVSPYQVPPYKMNMNINYPPQNPPFNQRPMYPYSQPNVQMPTLEQCLNLLSPQQKQEFFQLPKIQQKAVVEQLKMNFLRTMRSQIDQNKMNINNQQNKMDQQSGMNEREMTMDQTGNDSNQYYNSKPKRKRWTKHKELMLADDIETILQYHENQLRSETPYIDDFYFQNFMMINNPNLVDMELKLKHRPISDYRRDFSFLTPGLEGVLGKVPALSVRGPRPVLSLKDPETGEEVRSIGCKTVSFTSISRTLFSIEQSLIIVLEIEDLDSIIKTLQNEDKTYKNNLLKQRVERSEELFKSLRLLDPEVVENKIRYDDEYFLKLFTIPKGIQLIRHCFFASFLKTICYSYLCYNEKSLFSYKSTHQ